MTGMVAIISRRPLALAAPLSLLLALASSPAFAQSDGDRATARDLGREGQAALDQKDYKTAEDRFRRADKLVHAPTLELGLARALAGVGKYMESQETYNRIIREGVAPGAPDVFKQAVDAARAEVDSVSPHVAGATITVQADGGADVSDATGMTVTLDNQPLNTASLGVRRRVDPGDHVVKVSANGFDPAEARFTVAEGGSQSVQVTLHKASAATPAAAPSATGPADSPPDVPVQKRSVLPWIAFGVGGAGLLTGAIAGGLTLSQHSQISGDCGGGASCPTSEQGKIDSFHTVAMVSNIGFVVAGVGAAAGVILLLVHPYDTASTAPAMGLRVTPTVGFGSVGAVGSF